MYACSASRSGCPAMSSSVVVRAPPVAEPAARGMDHATGPLGRPAREHGAMISIGLVLGAGGVLGGAYHAGALAALAEVTGWDPRTADLIVGTSAGAHTAATLRAGVSAADHLARATDQPLSDEGAAITASAPDRLRLAQTS